MVMVMVMVCACVCVHTNVQAGNLVRMVMGLKKNFGKWEGNGFLKSFESQQMRFVQSNKNSVLVIPPLEEGNMPLTTGRQLKPDP